MADANTSNKLTSCLHSLSHQSFPQATLVAPSPENEFLHNSAQWLALVLLSTTLAAVGTRLTSFGAVQMIVFALVVMIYIPCLATIAASKKEF